MIPDLHPEELLDKAARGTLSVGERATLDAHLAECVVCRFAQAASDDFQRLPLPQLDVEHLVTNALTARASRSLRPPSRRVGALLAAAIALVAMGSFAAVGQWSGVLPRLLAALNTSVARPSSRPASASAPRASAPVSAKEDPPAPPLPSPPSLAETPPAPAVAPSLAPPAPSRSSASMASTSARHRSWGLGAVVREPSLDGPRPVPVASVERPASTQRPAPSSPETAADAFAAATRARLDGDHPLALARYREVVAFWPGSPEAQQARATLGRLLLDSGNAAAALESLDGYLGGHDATLREEVLSARAQALMRLGRVDEEARAWHTLLTEYPGTIHAMRARARLEALPAAAP